jgi:hypothetical protein
MQPAKDERMKTTAKHPKRALKLRSDNLEMLREEPKNIMLHNKAIKAHYEREREASVGRFRRWLCRYLAGASA